jgi:hypothetical protein
MKDGTVTLNSGNFHQHRSGNRLPVLPSVRQAGDTYQFNLRSPDQASVASFVKHLASTTVWKFLLRTNGVPRFNFALITAIAMLALGVLPVQAQVSREYQIKAVFLYNFAQFTQWPQSTFATDKSPIVIGVVGADPFGTSLTETIHGETIQGHPLVIEHYTHPADIKTCHILFVSQPESRRYDEITKIVKGKPVLTVSDTASAATSAAIIQFVIENNKVHFRVNTDAARAVNIDLSSKLLRVAEAPAGGGAPR